ncbi:hypothetical protein MHSWG343_06270 [Candidatus Mycoplasma haematohominis]|uniref:Uncharacterized protein n=1 Tax=Candidatus Mycoplasma haematohominis TaxID=1494318 RepID=A0A478FUA9_9MOLU|nr:hypothetical protein MHSWG343_06270 [Candidatus Mycoplasma haemohominis]
MSTNNSLKELFLDTEISEIINSFNKSAKFSLSAIQKTLIFFATISSAVATPLLTIYYINTKEWWRISSYLEKEILSKYDNIKEYIDEQSLYKAWKKDEASLKNYLKEVSDKYLSNLQKKIDDTKITAEIIIPKLVNETSKIHNQLAQDLQNISPNLELKNVTDKDISIKEIMKKVATFFNEAIEKTEKSINENVDSQKSSIYSKTVLKDKEITEQMKEKTYSFFKQSNWQAQINLSNSNKHASKIKSQLEKIKQEIEKEVKEAKKIFEKLKDTNKLKDANIENIAQEAQKIRIEKTNLGKQIKEKLKKVNEKIETIPKVLLGSLLNEKAKLLEDIEKLPEEASSLKSIIKNLASSQQISKDDFDKLRKNILSIYLVVEGKKKEEKRVSICDTYAKTFWTKFFTFGQGCKITKSAGEVVNYDPELIWLLVSLLCLFGTNQENNSREWNLIDVKYGQSLQTYVAGKAMNWFSEEEIDKLLKESMPGIETMLGRPTTTNKTPRLKK